MLRQASSRNHRSKGFKIKHALQICLLVAICIWLLYQVKHSHEKKKAFEERNLKMNKVGDNQADFFRFGRKDLPQVEETVSVNETHSKEEETEETQEEEEEHDTKREEIDDEEGRSVEEEEIDEQDQDNGDVEAEHGEESAEEEDKDSHEEDKDSHEQDKDNHDEIDVFDNQEHEGGTQEAREENYKRDDASSAVIHDTHVTESDTGNGGAGNTDEDQVADKVNDDTNANNIKGGDDTSSDGSKGEVAGENSEKNVEESENVTNGADEGSSGDNDLDAGSGGASVDHVSEIISASNASIQTDNLLSNATFADNKDVEVDNKDTEIEFSKPDNGTLSNSTTVEYDSQMEQKTNLTMAAGSDTQMELQTNSTGSVSDHPPEVQNNSTLVAADGISTSNDTASLDTAQNQNVAADNAAVGEDVQASQSVVEQADKSDTTSVVDSEEHSTGSSTQGESDDPSHPLITEEEKDARTDLSTLPEIQKEVQATDDEATEK